jgi:hypothetical protein
VIIASLEHGRSLYSEEKHLLKGLLRQKEVPAFFVREEGGERLT